jgi:hypothetical protein
VQCRVVIVASQFINLKKPRGSSNNKASNSNCNTVTIKWAAVQLQKMRVDFFAMLP